MVFHEKGSCEKQLFYCSVKIFSKVRRHRSTWNPSRFPPNGDSSKINTVGVWVLSEIAGIYSLVPSGLASS